MRHNLCKSCAARCGAHEFCQQHARVYYSPQVNGIAEDDEAAGIIGASRRSSRRGKKRPIDAERGEFALKVVRD